jgi:cellobiose-specific phosphotransferase system component IIB
MPRSIDALPTQKSHIDLSSLSEGDFGLNDYSLSFILDNVILVEYIDLSVEGDNILRNGIYVPVNTLTKAWRKGRVRLIGPRVDYVKEEDIVIFPNNLGVPVSNIEVTGYGKVKNGIFLNEDRIFGICKPLNSDECRDA